MNHSLGNCRTLWRPSFGRCEHTEEWSCEATTLRGFTKPRSRVIQTAAVFRALPGDNPQKIVFLQCRAESVSPDGGMLDPWGTRYKVYFSGKEPLIRSAGPNKQLSKLVKNVPLITQAKMSPPLLIVSACCFPPGMGDGGKPERSGG